jgi:hypothetical protein
MPKKKRRGRCGKLRSDEYIETNIMTGEARIRRRKKLKLF